MVALTVLLSGCQSTPAVAHLPDGVSISVFQPRPDVAKNRMAITVHNESGQPFTVTDAELASTYFIDDLAWGPDRTATVQNGNAVDLRVDIPAEPDCADEPPKHLVTITWVDGEQMGVSSVEPDDPYGVLDRLHDEACLHVRVAEVVELAAASLTAGRESGTPAELLIVATPTGETGIVTIAAIQGTTLLSPAGPDGVGVAELHLGIEIDADGPFEVRVPIVPNRCDVHALAEDKVGTRMPLDVVTSSGAAGRLVLSADDELRAQMYAFYSSYCGF